MQQVMTSLPCTTTPCRDCPFRMDSTPQWLGKERMEEILNAGSFTCHKTNKALQCAGHMLLKEEANDFVRLARRVGHALKLTGRALVFKTEQDCIKHHSHEG